MKGFTGKNRQEIVQCLVVAPNASEMAQNALEIHKYLTLLVSLPFSPLFPSLEGLVI